jgi:hypothetical protein
VTIEVSQPDRTSRLYTAGIGHAPNWVQGFANWLVGAGKSWKVQFNSPADKSNAGDYIYITGASSNRTPLVFKLVGGQQNYHCYTETGL